MHHRFYFLFHAPIPRTGGCSIVNRFSCQVYARADPPYTDLVNYATVTQSQPGAPVVGTSGAGSGLTAPERGVSLGGRPWSSA